MSVVPDISSVVAHFPPLSARNLRRHRESRSRIVELIGPVEAT